VGRFTGPQGRDCALPRARPIIASGRLSPAPRMATKPCRSTDIGTPKWELALGLEDIIGAYRSRHGDRSVPTRHETPVPVEISVISNIMPGCGPCNMTKHDMDGDAWRQYLSWPDTIALACGYLTPKCKLPLVHRICKECGRTAALRMTQTSVVTILSITWGRLHRTGGPPSRFRGSGRQRRPWPKSQIPAPVVTTKNSPRIVRYAAPPVKFRAASQKDSLR
jgi:hypothetical protein